MAARDPIGEQPGTGEPGPGRGTGAPGPGGGSGWREQVSLASGLNLLAGIWLIIAPFVLNYDSADPVWNDVVFGAAISILALGRIGGLYRESWLSWINVVLGAWIFISAFWLDDSATAAWNDIILGAIVVVLAVWSAGISDEANAVGAQGAAPRERGRRGGREHPEGV